jgi:hypothetical protein
MNPAVGPLHAIEHLDRLQQLKQKVVQRRLLLQLEAHKAARHQALTCIRSEARLDIEEFFFKVVSVVALVALATVSAELCLYWAQPAPVAPVAPVVVNKPLPVRELDLKLVFPKVAVAKLVCPVPARKVNRAAKQASTPAKAKAARPAKPKVLTAKTTTTPVAVAYLPKPGFTRMGQDKTGRSLYLNNDTGEWYAH